MLTDSADVFLKANSRRWTVYRITRPRTELGTSSNTNVPSSLPQTSTGALRFDVSTTPLFYEPTGLSGPTTQPPGPNSSTRTSLTFPAFRHPTHIRNPRFASFAAAFPRSRSSSRTYGMTGCVPVLSPKIFLVTSSSPWTLWSCMWSPSIPPPASPTTDSVG